MYRCFLPSAEWPVTTACYFYDRFDWMLLLYHVSVVALCIAAVVLYLRVMRHLPSRHWRKKLAHEPFERPAAAPQLMLELPSPHDSEWVHVDGISREDGRLAENRLRLSLGHGIHTAGRLYAIRSVVVPMVCAAITCAAFQWLKRMSTEEQHAAWVYQDALNTVCVQLAWGLPLVAIVCLLVARCRSVLEEYEFHLDRLGRQIRDMAK